MITILKIILATVTLCVAPALTLSACSSSSTQRTLPKAALACGGSATANGVLIKASQAKCEWPFRAKEAEIVCKKNNDVYARIGGRDYALNGMAMARGGLDLEPVWLPHPNEVMAKAGLNINVSEFLDIGLALCE